jgi:histidine triad (HIT) family protein
MTDCTVCDIVTGTAEASFVHQDEVVSAFLDIHPATPGHVLVVPNEHFPLARDLPEAVANQLFSVARRLARALIASELHGDGTNIMLADRGSWHGRAARSPPRRSALP